MPRDLTDDDLHEIAEKGRDNLSQERRVEKLTTIAVRQLITSSNFKRPRMDKIKKFEQLYQGQVPRKFRQLFTVPFPVFTSFVDTLQSDFSDPITCLFKDEDPSDYFKVKKIQAAFNKARKDLSPAGMWDLKVRADKKNAIMSGRGIQKYYASSDPDYKSHFNAVDYNYFHNQPNGGIQLENHLFAGEENIERTRQKLRDLGRSGVYRMEGVRNLIASSNSDDYENMNSSDTEAPLAKFRALNLDPQSHSYVGEPTYKLAEWVLTYKGRRWYLVFDPYTKVNLRCEPLEDVYSGEYLPWTSWSTHEDQRVFWNVGYSDFFYPIADATITLLNQELTNREKSNFNARAYDENMFDDEQKLDEAQYRPDALVSANTKNGTRKISDGLYRFDTPQLQGTIDLVGWVQAQGGSMGGAGGLQQGHAPKPGTKAYVQFQQQQQIEKRLSFKSQSYQECYQQIGLRFIEGLKDHMGEKMAIKMVGPQGYDHWDEITKIELSLEKTPHIEIQSTTAQENANKLKTDKRIDVLKELKESQNINPKMRDEFLLRYGGEFDEMDIALLMDVNSSVDKETQAKAAIALKELVEGKEPEMNYAADLVYAKIIHTFMVDHMAMLKKRNLLDTFVSYMEKIAPIAKENMTRLAQEVKLEKQYEAIRQGKDQQQGQEGDQQNPQPKPQNPSAPQQQPQMV